MTIQKLSQRAESILGLIVKQYIETGNPVGSSALVKSYNLPWSSATIRNEMGNLSHQGYLSKPHVSAGRVPTEQGVRFYVDCLLCNSILTVDKKDDINKRYQTMDGTLDEIVEKTSKILSEFSAFAGFATIPSIQFIKIKFAEIVKLSHNRVLIVFVLEGGITEKKLLKIYSKVTMDQVQRMSRYLNDISVGFTIDELKTKVLPQIKNERRLYRDIIRGLLNNEGDEDSVDHVDIFIKGGIAIIDNYDLNDFEQIIELLKAYEDKDILAKLLDSAVKESGTTVYVGAANGVVRGCSLIAAPYGKDHTLGTVGVLGPIRMNYSKLIPLVDYTARSLSNYIVNDGV